MIVLVGASGFIGQAFADFFRDHDVEFHGLSRRELNYYDDRVLRNWLADRSPDFLINAAGFTGRPNVDACETNKTDCLLGNAVLPGMLRRACEPLGIAWGHVSSGCVYTGDGPGGKGFRETDDPNFTFRQNNCSFYSGCKALGEEVLRDAVRCYIWRLRIPFSHVDSPRNYLSKLMTYARLLDVRNSLSSLDDFVRACYECWRKDAPFGTYNMTNTGSVTTREIVEMIRQQGLSEKEFQYFSSEEEFMRVAARTPRSNCVLDNSKAIAAGLSWPDVQAALNAAIRNWQPAADAP